jgi:hypothetical protein
MKLKVIDHYFLLDGGSVGINLVNEFNVKYELFVDLSVDTLAKGRLSIASPGRNITQAERDQLIDTIDQLLTEDLPGGIGADETEILNRVLIAAGRKTPEPITTSSHEPNSPSLDSADFTDYFNAPDKPVANQNKATTEEFQWVTFLVIMSSMANTMIL